MNNSKTSQCEDIEIPAFKYYLDWNLIVGSIAKQYNLLITEMTSDEDLSWETFELLVSQLDEETNFGKIVGIRLETDYEVIKNFNRKQKKIWNEWQEQIPIHIKDRIAEQKLEAMF